MKRFKIIGFVGIFAIAGPLGGCSDDDDDQAVCGNGQIEGSEQCDMDQLAGLTCQDVDSSFTGGTLACSGDCTYDTSGCTTGDECGDGNVDPGEDCDGNDLDGQTCESVGDFTGGSLSCDADCNFVVTQCVGCGNGIVEAGEDCDGSDLDGQTCQDVGNFTGGTLGCDANCNFDTGQCAAGEDCNNGVIDAGEDCDGTNLGGNECVDVGPYSGGILNCANDCTFDTSTCELSTAGQIDNVLSAADGTSLGLPVNGAWVTYVKPAIGNDPAGFFLQSVQAGPALFVAIDPTTLTPEPTFGDEVDLVVEAKETDNSLPQVTDISGYARVSTGNAYTSLAQNVTGASDLVTHLDDYTYELINVDLTITGPFGFAGSGHKSAPVDTTALINDPDLELRLPTSLVNSSGLDEGCILTVENTPLWRYQSTAQISAWELSELTITSCDAPQVLSALATASDTVVVTFSRDLDPNTVNANGDQFTIEDASSNDLTVTAASVTANEVTLTTAAQTGNADYTVTVAATVEDIYNVGVDQAANTASFLGYEDFQSQLYIWEVDANNPGGDDAEFFEIWNNTGAQVDFGSAKYFVLLLNGGNNGLTYDAYQLTGTLANDAVYTVGEVANVDLSLSGSIQNGVDGILLVRCDTCSGTSDFPGGTDVGSNNTFTVNSHTATKIDALCYDTNASFGDDATLRAKLMNVPQCWDEGDANADLSNQRLGANGWIPQTVSPTAK